MNSRPEPTSATERLIPYQAWWGLAACGLIMGIIWLLGPYREFELLPRRFTFDYPWKLPEPTVWTHLTAWSLYALHQVGVWYLIYKGTHMKLRYVQGLHPVNVQMLGWNGLFVALHIAQTTFFYDGLAQDVPEFTALGSVALMMLVILIMENDRRGLFFSKRVSFPKGVGESARKYHGYYFSWAITYTFWYHPIEISQGHLMGLFFMMMLFLQGSLFLTRFHINRWWTVFLEFFAVLHGATVAWFSVTQTDNQWSNFLFGGLAVFLITQMHGVRLKRWHKLTLTGFCLGMMGWFYAAHQDMLISLTSMVLTRYLAVFILVGLIWLIMRPFIRSGRAVPGIKREAETAG